MTNRQTDDNYNKGPTLSFTLSGWPNNNPTTKSYVKIFVEDREDPSLASDQQ